MRHLLAALCLMVASSALAQTSQLDNLGLSLIPSPKECTVKSAGRHRLKECRIVKHATPHGADEYGVSIRRGKATLWGNEAWAKQTLRQLTDVNGCVPDVEIHDWASYPIRGFMHDTGRNYQTLDMLKRTIDAMSLYRLNMFHWHLTDSTSWRIECPCFPQLNDPK